MRFLMLVVTDPEANPAEEPPFTIEEWVTETSESGVNLDGDRLQPVERAKTEIFAPDWKKVFERDAIAENIRMITSL